MIPLIFLFAVLFVTAALRGCNSLVLERPNFTKQNAEMEIM